MKPKEVKSSQVELRIKRGNFSYCFKGHFPVVSNYPNIRRINMNKLSKADYFQNYTKENKNMIIPISFESMRKKGYDLLEFAGKNEGSKDKNENILEKLEWKRYCEKEFAKYLESQPRKDDGKSDSKCGLKTLKTKVEVDDLRKKEINERSEEIVLLQRYAKRFFARKKLKVLKHKFHQRKMTILEFFNTELVFLKNIRVLDEVYHQEFKRLEKKNKSPISSTVINHLFSGLTVIIGFSDRFTKALKKTIFLKEDTTKYNHHNNLGKVIMELAPYIKMYTNYCSKHEKNTKLIEGLKKKNKKFSSLLSKLNSDKRTNQLGLNSYLFAPIQRILKYKLFMKGIIKNTFPEHIDYPDLCAARDVVLNVSLFLNESVKEMEKSEFLLKMQKDFISSGKEQNVIFSSHRRFVSKEKFNVISKNEVGKLKKKKEVHVHLFNDLITFSNSNGNKYKIFQKLSLKNLSIFYCGNNSLFLKINNIILNCINKQQRDRWLYLIFDLLQREGVSQEFNTQEEEEDEIREILESGGVEMREVSELSDDECILKCKDINNPIKMWKYVSSENLAKKIFKNFNKPHERLFVISNDETKLYWGSKNKGLDESCLEFSKVRELVTGQTTKTFKKFPKPELQKQSFSLLFGNGHYLEDGGWSGESLDLIAESPKNFEIFIKAIKVILQGKREHVWERLQKGNSEKISKEDLFIDKKKERNKMNNAYKATGDVYTFGRGLNCVLGNGDEKDCFAPKVVFDLLLVDVKQTHCSAYGGACVTKNGKLLTWGESRCVGHELTNRKISKPKQLFIGRKIIKVKLGEKHGLLLDANGNVFGFGCNKFGQVGCIKGKTDESEKVGYFGVTMVISNKNFPVMVDIDCGIRHSGSLSRSGVVYLWGCGEDAQLGPISESKVLSQREPKKISSIGSKVIQISLGCWHTLILDEFGKVYAWGSNNLGQLAKNPEEIQESLTPIQIEGLDKKIVSISSGNAHCAAIDCDGVCYTWGEGSDGKLGIGRTSKINFQVNMIEKVLINNSLIDQNEFSFESVSLGANHSLGLIKVKTVQKKGESYKKVVSFGSGIYGRLGLNDKSEKEKIYPTSIPYFDFKSVRCVITGPSSFSSQVICSHDWIDDSDAIKCMNKKCQRKFTVVYRRHHCRNCGGVFCDKCSSKRIPLLMFGFGEEVRVCDKCYNIISKKGFK